MITFSEFEKTCLELENTLNKILNNVIEKIPTLNLDGLNAMISALKAQKDTDYITPAHGLILGGQKQQEYIDLFKSKIATSIQMIGSKINEVQLQKEMEKRGIPNPNQEQPNPTLDNGTPVAPTIFEEVETELLATPITQSFEPVKSEPQPYIPTHDIERFQVIADFDKRMLDMYKDGMEQIKALSFDNKSLEELKTNMLLIETKAKECVENANFKLGKTDNLGDTEKTTRINEAKKELKGIEITEADNINIELSDYNYYYKLTEDNLKDMGLSNIKLSDTDELYIVKYDIQNAKVEIYNTKGYEGKYSLTDIEQIEK